MLSRMTGLRLSRVYPALSCISPAPVDGRHCYKGRASSHRVRSPLSQQQLRCISIKASDSSWREQLQLEVREEMLNYAHHFYAHSMPPAFFESYLTVLSSMCGSNWGLTLAMAVLSIQPIILPLIVYARMHSFSMERALKPYTGAVSKYIHELTSVHDYAVAWRAYRSRRDMLKSFGFFIPWKVALSLVEIPLVGCLALGAALLESSHGNLGSWLWLSDFGAADPTYLSPLLFFLSVSARVMVGDASKSLQIQPSYLIYQICIVLSSTMLLQSIPAIVYWTGLLHNACVVPAMLFCRRDQMYRGHYVPRMNPTLQAIVKREADGKSYPVPHAKKLVDRFAPELGKRPLLLADFDPEKVEPPARLPLSDAHTQSALTNVKSTYIKRDAIEKAREAPKPKVRRR